MKSAEAYVTNEVNEAWLESLRNDTSMRVVAEEVGIEFPADCPPRFVGDLAQITSV